MDRTRFDPWGRPVRDNGPTRAGRDGGHDGIEILQDGNEDMADNEEAAVSSQAPVDVGFFDAAPMSDQAQSRARAAQEDLAVRSRALANRAPDLLARIGGLKDAGAAEAKAAPKPAASPAPVAPQPVAPKPAAAPQPTAPQPVAPKPVAPKPVATKPAAAPPPEEAAPQPAAASEPVAAQAVATVDGPGAQMGHPVDALQRLRVLAAMLDEGLIERTEFDAKKAEVLARL